jgi:hypothetical protein
MKKDYFKTLNAAARGYYGEGRIDIILDNKGFKVFTKVKSEKVHLGHGVYRVIVKPFGNKSHGAFDSAFYDSRLDTVYFAAVRTKIKFPVPFDGIEIEDLVDACKQSHKLCLNRPHKYSIPLVILRDECSRWYVYPSDLWRRTNGNYKFLYEDGVPLSWFKPGKEL